MFGSALRNAGRRVFNFSQRRGISAESWSGNYDANIVFGGEKIGASDIGALLGAFAGAKIVTNAFCQSAETPLEKVVGTTLGIATGGLGGGLLGAIASTPVGTASIAATVVIACAGERLAEKASHEKPNSKSR